MSLETAPASSEVAILSRVIRPDRSNLSAAVARAWLKLDFDPQDQGRMHELALKAQEGVLTANEQGALEAYRRVGRFLDLVHSKARLSLKKRGLSA
jgi:hypothetical protein